MPETIVDPVLLISQPYSKLVSPFSPRTEELFFGLTIRFSEERSLCNLGFGRELRLVKTCANQNSNSISPKQYVFKWNFQNIKFRRKKRTIDSFFFGNLLLLKVVNLD